MKYLLNILKFLFPFVLGGGILYWMYRDFPFSSMEDILLNEMRWEWMLLSFIPGILAQVFRGLRWKQSLAPMDEHPRTSSCINAIFLSYAVSLIVPRVGEVTRCGVLKKHDSTSFAKSLGTVVTERLVDSVIVAILIGITFLFQVPVFLKFFKVAGIKSFSEIFSQFTSTGIIVTVICIICILCTLFILLKRLSISHRIKDSLLDIKEGLLSLRKISNVPLYLVYSLGIWVAYFLHYYLTFYCFDFTQNLGLTAGLISFWIGTVAVVVPTPNGAGSWHFAVKTALVLYGLGQVDAVMFVFIVHSIQTLLLVFLGIYALVSLQISSTISKKS